MLGNCKKKYKNTIMETDVFFDGLDEPADRPSGAEQEAEKTRLVDDPKKLIIFSEIMSPKFRE